MNFRVFLSQESKYHVRFPDDVIKSEKNKKPPISRHVIRRPFGRQARVVRVGSTCSCKLARYTPPHWHRSLRLFLTFLKIARVQVRSPDGCWRCARAEIPETLDMMSRSQKEGHRRYFENYFLQPLCVKLRNNLDVHDPGGQMKRI